ncbi:MAG: DDE-type integrase/transposase/recombinase [Pseudomonadota bacterium]
MQRKPPFKHHRFPRGITIDRSTVYRWVQTLGPELARRTEKNLRRASVDWHVDETYIRVGGKWRYLWRAIDANGQMVDFRLTARRDAKAAKATLSGIETIRTIKRGHVHHKQAGVKGEIQVISQLFAAA